MLLNCGVGEDSWESPGLQGDPTSPSWGKSVLSVHWKDWCWSWNSNTLATWCEELTRWKRPWCWERLRAGGEGDDRGWDVGWHHQLNGHEFGWTPAVGDGQGGLVCCGSWGHKELDTTEQLNWLIIDWLIHGGRLALCVCVCVYEREKSSDQLRKEKEGGERYT